MSDQPAPSTTQDGQTGDASPTGRLAAALRAGQELSVFAGVMSDEAGRLMLELLGALLGQTHEPSPSTLYARLFALLVEEAELSRAPLFGDAWRNHLLERLLLDENVLSRKLVSGAGAEVGGSLLAQAGNDLARLQVLYALDARTLVERVSQTSGQGNAHAAWAAWDDVRPLTEHGDAFSIGHGLKRRLACLSDWHETLPELLAHYASGGSGLFGQYVAFRWSLDGASGRLEGIAEPDPIRLEDLIGYESERELLIRNTEWFVRGLPANNVLVYGERGTGKSSTIKALLHAYAGQGLRMLEVSKHDLASFPSILAQLRGRPERFILFVDDLSFEEHETHYKELKAILEGGLEARPSNVLLYATSNRRHLVQERWTDREAFDHFDVHARDAMQEKLSLADRFGITLTFIAPDQERYLAIVEGLARSRGLDVSPDELRRRAIQWAQWQNARSGRTARQFVDYLTAELAERVS